MGILLGMLVFILAVAVGVVVFVVYKANALKNKVEDAAIDAAKQVIIENAPKVGKVIKDKVNSKLNLLVILISMCSFTSFSQSDTVKMTCCSSKDSVKNYNTYLGGDISLSNGNDFKTNTFISMEYGVCSANFGAAVVFGRGNIDGMGRKGDNLTNYFLEGKVMGYIPIGNLVSTVMFGYGGYVNTPNMFIEYGAGIGYTKKNITYGILYSNWGGTNYITPNISYNF